MTEKNKPTVMIFTIIASLIPAVALMKFPTSMTVASVPLWASAVLGYMGIVLLLWMYILGAKSLMGLVFQDLAPVLKIHKWLGKYGLIAIFLHPILITISYGESWLYSFIPQLSTVAERHIMLGQIAFWLLLIVWLTSAIVRDRIAFRPWRYIHWLAYMRAVCTFARARPRLSRINRYGGKSLFICARAHLYNRHDRSSAFDPKSRPQQIYCFAPSSDYRRGFHGSTRAN